MPGREPIPLHRAMPVLDAFRVIARDCLQRLSDQAQQFGDIGGAEPLHQCRVAIRQLRAALALFQPALSHGGAIRFQTELRSEEHTSELQSLLRMSYAVFCLKTKNR